MEWHPPYPPPPRCIDRSVYPPPPLPPYNDPFLYPPPPPPQYHDNDRSYYYPPSPPRQHHTTGLYPPNLQPPYSQYNNVGAYAYPPLSQNQMYYYNPSPPENHPPLRYDDPIAMQPLGYPPYAPPLNGKKSDDSKSDHNGGEELKKNDSSYADVIDAINALASYSDAQDALAAARIQSKIASDTRKAMLDLWDSDDDDDCYICGKKRCKRH